MVIMGGLVIFGWGEVFGSGVTFQESRSHFFGFLIATFTFYIGDSF